MNRKERRELEEKVRLLALEPYEPTTERMEEIKRRAYEEYVRRSAKKRSLYDYLRRKIQSSKDIH